MSGPRWVKLDNAANIFLAARSEVDPKVFRISAEIDEVVDPLLLQIALDDTYDRFPLYHAVLRSGVFWYYLQDSALRPEVAPETEHTCAALYQPDRRNLLFRVLYHRRRIILEIFHALSDGTGALWFLSDLVNTYTTLRHPEEAGRARAEMPEVFGDQTLHELSPDSFTEHFRKRRRGSRAHDSVAVQDTGANAPAARQPKSMRGIYRVKGTRTPDSRTRLVELTMPSNQLLALSKALGVSPTIYLTGLFFESIRKSAGNLGKARTMTASVPVNLRQFFPSNSARNFFATVRVEHTYSNGDADDLASVCTQLERQFRQKVTPQALEKKVRKLIRFEKMVVVRLVPRVLQDPLLRLINWGNNRGLTVAVSNLGRVVLPEPAESHVGRMQFHVSAVRPQFCALSHGGLLTVSFTSPFVETDHIRVFTRTLTDAGIDVRLALPRVTEEEFSEAERSEPERSGAER